MFSEIGNWVRSLGIRGAVRDEGASEVEQGLLEAFEVGGGRFLRRLGDGEMTLSIASNGDRESQLEERLIESQPPRIPISSDGIAKLPKLELQRLANHCQVPHDDDTRNSDLVEALTPYCAE